MRDEFDFRAVGVDLIHAAGRRDGAVFHADLFRVVNGEWLVRGDADIAQHHVAHGRFGQTPDQARALSALRGRRDVAENDVAINRRALGDGSRRIGRGDFRSELVRSRNSFPVAMYAP